MGFSARVAQHIRSNAVGYVAVFLALTGTAAALPGTNSVDSGDIINGQVGTRDLGVAAVRTGRLAPSSVTGGKVADGTLGGADVADGTIGHPDLAQSSVTEGNVVDGSLTDSDIANETLTGTNVRDGFLTGADVADNSLTGADVSESTLGQVPSATLGGLGRSASQTGLCDPENATGFSTCAGVSLTLPAATRVALFGRVTGHEEPGAESGHGDCRLATSSNGAVGGSQVNVDVVQITASGLRTSVGGANSSTAVTPTVGPGTVSFSIECNQVNPGAIFYSDGRITAVAISPG